MDKRCSLYLVCWRQVGGPAHYTWLREAVESTQVSATVLGGVPKTDSLAVAERHLGLHMPGEEGMPSNYFDQLADLMEEHLDLDKILEQAGEAKPPLSTSLGMAVRVGDGEDGEGGLRVMSAGGRAVRVGVAKDQAFCFYYHHNLRILQGAAGN